MWKTLTRSSAPEFVTGVQTELILSSIHKIQVKKNIKKIKCKQNIALLLNKFCV